VKTIALALILAALAPAAHATYCTNGATNYPSCSNTPPRDATPDRVRAPAHDVSLYVNPLSSSVSGASSSSGTSSGNTYVFPAPAAAAALPSGLCPMGDSESWSVVWGFVSYARSSMRTEMECLDKLIAYGKATQPQPQPAQAINYIAPPPAVVVQHAAPAECPVPKQAAKPAAKKRAAPACPKR
jgi:hypothetical protein